jgi:hypothetical protein
MNVTIRDSDVLNSLRPADLLTYLRAAGWQREADVGEKAEVWMKRDGGGNTIDLVVPLRREAKDFALRASELLRTLEDVEGRSQQEILEDIEATSADIIRIRAISSDAANGTISLDSGVIFVQQAREMVLAAACATVVPKPFWATRKPPAAVEYMKKIRLGQTERGSFVITVQSPVSPALRTHVEPEQPFERQVIETLSDSLLAVHSAARQAAATGDVDSFQSSVQVGVSANLCDAIVRLFEAIPGGELSVLISWSKSRPSLRGPNYQATFSADFIPVIAEASRLFKRTTPEHDFQVTGFVERLERITGVSSGHVWIENVIDRGPRRVSIELKEHDYELAAKAHVESCPISCVGDLVKTGRSYQLQSPRDLRIMDSDLRRRRDLQFD